MKRRKSFRQERRKIKKQAGGISYNPMGSNWLMPPRIMTPPTARLTSRLCNRVVLRSAFKAQKPLRSRAKDCCSLCRAWESKMIESKEKENIYFKHFGKWWRGGERGSDKHTRYSNSPSRLCPPVLSDRGEIVKRERDRGGAVVCLYL